MSARRVDHLLDQMLVVELDAARCLDTADFLARHCGRYGIQAELEFRRHPGTNPDGRHFVLCHQAAALRPNRLAQAPTRPLWVMHVQITRELRTAQPAGAASMSAPAPDRHRVSTLVRPPRSLLHFNQAAQAARAARQYQELLSRALRLAEAARHESPDHRSNVVSLRPYLDLPPLISA